MLKKNIKNLLFAVNKDARITSKSLGKTLRKSQQSAHYLLHSLEDKKAIKKYITVFDTAKLGLINFVVLLRCHFVSQKEQQHIIQSLQENVDVIHIEKLDIGWDFLVMFSTQNISRFNKSLKSFLTENRSHINTFSVLPIIVMYHLGRKYLNPKQHITDTILFGDRDQINITKNEFAVCHALQNNARESFFNIAKKIKADPKMIMRSKTNLEKKKIIMGYSILLDNKKLGIKRFLIPLKLKDYTKNIDTKLIHYCKNDKNVIALLKTLGEWDAILIVEYCETRFSDFLTRFKEETSTFIADYTSTISDEVILEEYLPKSIFEESN